MSVPPSAYVPHWHLESITNETRSRASMFPPSFAEINFRDAGERRCSSTDKIGASPTALQVQSRQYKQSWERVGSAYVISCCATVRGTHYPRQTANVNSQRRSICSWTRWKNVTCCTNRTELRSSHSDSFFRNCVPKEKKQKQRLDWLTFKSGLESGNFERWLSRHLCCCPK